MQYYYLIYKPYKDLSAFGAEYIHLCKSQNLRVLAQQFRGRANNLIGLPQGLQAPNLSPYYSPRMKDINH